TSPFTQYATTLSRDRRRCNGRLGYPQTTFGRAHDVAARRIALASHFCRSNLSPGAHCWRILPRNEHSLTGETAPMDATPNLDLPYIMGAQAQKHVTHNEAIRKLDALVQLAVLDRDLTAPPTSPA